MAEHAAGLNFGALEAVAGGERSGLAIAALEIFRDEFGLADSGGIESSLIGSMRATFDYLVISSPVRVGRNYRCTLPPKCRQEAFA